MRSAMRTEIMSKTPGATTNCRAASAAFRPGSAMGTVLLGLLPCGPIGSPGQRLPDARHQPAGGQDGAHLVAERQAVPALPALRDLHVVECDARRLVLAQRQRRLGAEDDRQAEGPRVAEED